VWRRLRHGAPLCVLITGATGRGRLSRGGAAVDANGAVVLFGNSSGGMASINFFDFRGGQNTYAELILIPSPPEEQIALDLALLVSLVADESLTPQTARSETPLRQLPLGGIKGRESVKTACRA
jgi:hypothetical protein